MTNLSRTEGEVSAEAAVRLLPSRFVEDESRLAAEVDAAELFAEIRRALEPLAALIAPATSRAMRSMGCPRRRASRASDT